MAAFPLLDLPYELKRRTASFLSSGDAVRMSVACKSLHSSLSLTCLPARELFTERVYSTTPEDHCQRVTRIPVLSRRVHSLRLTCRWQTLTTGWLRNRQGQVWIVGEKQGVDKDPNVDFEGGRVVVESPLAPLEEEALTMSFVPVEGEDYYLWYKVGTGRAGQRRRLRLLLGNVTTVVFDDKQRNVSRNYRRLAAAGLLSLAPPVYPTLLLSVCRSLRRQLANEQVLDDGLAAFFSAHDIPLNEKSLFAVEEIIKANIDEQAMAVEERQEPGTRPNMEERLANMMDVPDMFVELMAPIMRLNEFFDVPDMDEMVEVVQMFRDPGAPGARPRAPARAGPGNDRDEDMDPPAALDRQVAMQDVDSDDDDSLPELQPAPELRPRRVVRARRPRGAEVVDID